MVEITILSVVFLGVICLVILRFTTVLRQILDSIAVDRRERARELDEAHTRAFSNAMTALEDINQRIVTSQTDMFARTVDMVAGPQHSPQSSDVPDNPHLDARAPWQPDDDFDYTGLGLDPTDDTLPMPPVTPDDTTDRAVMVRPGEGLLPKTP